nr:unnamed protein product [Callosobruchus analis]
MEEPADSASTSSTRKCITAILCGRTSLFVLMTGYALLGALIFKAIEGGGEEHPPVDFQKSREDCLKELWLITGERVCCLLFRRHRQKQYASTITNLQSVTDVL